jgi:cytochrome c-type biogenesis protein CcmH/NrfG
MAKPLEERSDEELKRGLAEGEFGEKKAVIAQEILRRRQEAKAQELKRKYRWFGSILAALSVALVAFRRFWRK